MYGSALPRPSTTKPVAAATNRAATSKTKTILPERASAGAAVDRFAGVTAGILGDTLGGHRAPFLPAKRVERISRAS